MRPGVRTPMILTLALASLARTRDLVAEARTGTRRSGWVVHATAEDGTILTQTEQGPVFLMVASDAAIRGDHGDLTLADVARGDAIEWVGADGQSVVMVDRLWVRSGGTSR